MSNNTLNEDVENLTTSKSRTSSSPPPLGNQKRPTNRHKDLTMHPAGNARDTEAPGQQIDMTGAAAQRLQLHENVTNPRPLIESNLMGTHQQRHTADQHILSNAINRDKASVASRIESFCNRWPDHIVRATTKELAEAGLFHLGESDKTKCFYCNGGLQNWDYNDDPWTEHAKWYPTCDFVLAKRGIDFVLRAVKAHTKQTISQSQNLSSFGAGTMNASTSPCSPTLQAGIPRNQNKISEIPTNCRGRNRFRGQVSSIREINHTPMRMQRNFVSVPIRPAKRGTTESDALPIVHCHTSDAETEPAPSYVFMSDPRSGRDRLASFTNYPEPFLQSMWLAARQGFFFTGVGDVARCYSCNVTWHISQGAYTTNLHHSDCQTRNQQPLLDNVHMNFQFLELLQQGRCTSQPAASSGESTGEPQTGPSSPKRRRSNDSRQHLQ